MSGDAFNRKEVSSVYVEPGSRYVVSLVVGSDAETPEEALREALSRVQGPERAVTVWSVHDRETGETYQMYQSEVEEGTIPT